MGGAEIVIGVLLLTVIAVSIVVYVAVRRHRRGCAQGPGMTFSQKPGGLSFTETDEEPCAEANSQELGKSPPQPAGKVQSDPEKALSVEAAPTTVEATRMTQEEQVGTEQGHPRGEIPQAGEDKPLSEELPRHVAGEVEPETTPLLATTEPNENPQPAQSQILMDEADKAEEQHPLPLTEVAPEETRDHRATQEGEVPAGDVQTRRVEPIKRGGRPRVSTSDARKPQSRASKPRAPKPEIICLKRERHWTLAIEVPEGFAESSRLAVVQDGSELEQDETGEGLWYLQGVSGSIVVSCNGNESPQQTVVPLDRSEFLLFKLIGSNQNRGRRAASPSSGWYLVVVPEDWERDEALSGPPRIAPEPVSISGYQAHFFSLRRTDEIKIAFRVHGGQSVVIEARAEQFELVGNRLDDASENVGPLFHGVPPRIRPAGNPDWRNVETVVVGEEGGGKGSWRVGFAPEHESTEQQLPADIATRGAGWYFIRFYDGNGDLIESMDFRFAPGLNGINTCQPTPFPSDGGHRTVRVEMTHELGYGLQQASGVQGAVKLEHGGDRTVLSIPADPKHDRTTWLIGPQRGPRAEVCILVERIWWAAAEENGAIPEWRDEPLMLSRDEFVATSNKVIWVRLPDNRWVNALLVGFSESKARRFVVNVSENTITVPLREFGDSEEVRDVSRPHVLKAWADREHGRIEGVLGIIPAEHTPITEQSVAAPPLRVASRQTLVLDTISEPQLAGVLTTLKKAARGPLRVLIKEIRRQYVHGRSATHTDSAEFAKRALCAVAFCLDLYRGDVPLTQQLKKRWIDRALIARDKFPEAMNWLQGRYEKLCRRLHIPSAM